MRGEVILVVEDHELARTALVRQLGDRRVRTASSATTARELLTTHDDWVGFLIDAGLPEGPLSGLALLRTIREAYPRAPAAIITGRLEMDVVNGSRELDADVIMKTAPIAELLAHTLARIDRATRDPIESIRDAAARGYTLSPREAQLLEWFLRGRDAASFAVHVGISRVTVKDYRESLLRKTGDTTSAALVARLLAESLRGRR